MPLIIERHFFIFIVLVSRMKYIYFLALFFSCLTFSQEQEQPEIGVLDSLYREDQFYFGLTYNILKNKPSGVSQNSLSSSLSLGFLRDMPVNKKRTFAFAGGLGITYSNFKQNIIISKVNGQMQYALIPADAEYDKNKFSFTTLDVPLEIRWRTSTMESHKFWRIYAGLKSSYVFYNAARYKSNSIDYKVSNNPDFNKLLFNAYLASGYNNWNIYVSYGLNDMFKKNLFENSNQKLRSLNLGLIFYIL